MHYIRRILASILVLTLMIQILPLSAVAESNNESIRRAKEQSSSSTIKAEAFPGTEAEAGQPGTTVVGEVESLRDETQKHFRLDDGSYIAVDYGMPVHYSEDGGKSWNEIDNTLVLSGGGESSRMQAMGQAAQERSYTAKNGESAHSFASDLRSGFLFSARNGSHGLRMSLSDPYKAGDASFSREDASETGAAAQSLQATETADETETVEVTTATESEEASQPSEATVETERMDEVEASTDGTEDTQAAESVEAAESMQRLESSEVTESAQAEETTAATEATEELRPAEALAAAEAAQPEETAGAAQAMASEASTEESETLQPAQADPAAEDTERYDVAAVAEVSYPAQNKASLNTLISGNLADTLKRGISALKGDSKPSLSEQLTPKKLQADVLYRNVYQGVDLRYALCGYNVKETIVINQPRSSYSFPFYLDLTDLSPSLMKDGSVELRDRQGEVVYLIPAPYMIDAAGAESTAVSYKLEKSKSGAWKLSVVADAAWINAKGRAFPVEIDPTVVLFPYSGHDHILTSYVNSGRPGSASYNNTGYLRSGYYNNTSYDANCTGHTVGLIYINTLPRVPDNCIVTGAQLGLTQALYGGLDNANYHKLYATKITTPSNPKSYLGSMTWNNYKSNILPNYAKLGTETTPTALDYQKESAKTGKETMYDITNAARRWYDPKDNSISRLLVLDNGHSSTTNARVTYGGYGYSPYEPRILVTYRNVVGIEGIYGYHTQNIGRAGTGYINDFTMQPTLSVPITSSPSTVLPFGICLIYNGGLSYSQFTRDSNSLFSNTNNLNTAYYTNSKTGFGWKTSLQQTVRYAFYDIDQQYVNNRADITWLVYTDADGTEHYFNPQNGSSSTPATIYKDEDGLNLTIHADKVNGDNSKDLFTMTDKEGNKWIFHCGYLTEYTDYHGNKLFYAYDGKDYSASNTNWKPADQTNSHRVTGVWRKNNGGTIQKLATLSYYNGYLNTIKDAADRITQLGYTTDGQLNSIGFPDGQFVSYAYSAYKANDGRTYYRLTEARDNEARYKINYTYRGNRPLHVESYIERTKSNGAWIDGQKVNCFQTNSNYSRFRYFDAGDTSGKGKAVTQHYFDNWGRTVNVVTMDPEETTVLGVSTGAYTANKKDDSSKNNRLTNAASAGIQAVNLLQNSDLEHTTDLYGWTKDSAGGNAASRADSGTSVLVKPYLGKSLMKLYETNESSGTYKVCQSAYLEKGQTYVFSAYVNTVCVNAFGTDGGAYLSILQGSTQKAKSRVINYKTNTSIEGGWERVELSFTPTASGTYQVAANIHNINQIAVFDNFQLEKCKDFGGKDLSSVGGKAGTASTVNLLQAGSFEFPKSTDGSPDRTNVNQWWSYDSSKACPVNQSSADANAHSGKFLLSIAPSVTQKQRAVQTVQINGSSNKTYILSGWGWTPQTNMKNEKKMEEDNKNGCRFFGLIAKVTYTDSKLAPDYHYVSFNDSVNEWQFASAAIVPKQRDKTVSTITVSACLDYCANRAYMDDISLIQEPVQSYSYDDKGNLIQATNSEGKSSTTMDGKDRMTGYTSITGVKYELSYSGDSRDPLSITSDGVKTGYTYDAAGNVTKTKVQPSAGGKYLESTNACDGTKNFQTQSTDVNGAKSTSTYNVSTGQLTQTKTPRGQGTDYTYVSNSDRISSTSVGGYADLFYSYYGNGQLMQLNRQTTFRGTKTQQAYSFSYDAWGNTTEIRVGQPANGTGTLTLASYAYDSAGKKTRMNYPSGQYVTYSYDILDRLAKEVYYNKDNSVQAEYQYIYGSDGQLSKQQVIRNGKVTESYSFEYDSLGRLIRSREEGGSRIVQRTEHLYDTANRLTRQNWTVGERNFREFYSYNAKDGTMASMNLQYDCGVSSWGYATDKLTYGYDALKRLTKVTDTENGALFYTRNYTYQTLSGDQVSNRLAQYDYRNPGGSIIYGNRYVYDANGNITQINEVYGNNQTRVLAKYEYDWADQLSKETRYSYNGNSATVKDTTEVTYASDTAGNLREVTTKVNGTQTDKITYTYGDGAWADRLTKLSVNDVTKDIAYGDYCNPKTWYNGTDYSNLTWTQGRRLSSISKGSQTYSYEYDMSGVRSVKLADGKRHEYVTQNGKVVRDKVTDASTGAFQYMLDFTYDESGHPLTMRSYFNEAQNDYSTYHYVLNAQGDVIKLMHGSNKTVAEYSYDAWGNVLRISGAELGNLSVAELNPLRYRGYYCDTETGFYYLQSRYYDPIVRRFLNGDSFASTGQGILGYNSFAYCNNNPVTRVDNSGAYPIWPTLFADHHFGFIHLAVQMHIVEHNPGVEMEQTVYKGTKQRGRADIVDPLNNNQVWEIKTAKTGAAKATKQLEKYYGDGQTLGKNGPNTTIGAAGRFEGAFALTCGKDVYSVVYCTPFPGVILYDVQKTGETEYDPYAVYVPTKESSPSRRTTIGGIPAYATLGLGGVLLYEVCKWGAAALLAPCSGGTSFGAAAAMP